MKYNKKIFKAEFISRPNRFNAIVKLNEEEIKVHVPNTGRCREILVQGCTVFLREEPNPTRKTPYDLMAVYKGEKLISIDSQIPNKVVDEALRNKKIKGLEEYTNILREKTFGKSRFDFKISTEEGKEYFLEVKGVTLEDDGYARFPDAPTEIRKISGVYHKAAVLFNEFYVRSEFGKPSPGFFIHNRHFPKIWKKLHKAILSLS